MSNELIRTKIELGIPQSEVTFAGGACQLQALVVSDAFEGLSRVARQQLVYNALGDVFASGQVHALSLKTFTKAEWSKAAIVENQNHCTH